MREIQAAFVRLESLLQQQDQEVHGQFRLAAIPTIAPYVLPASISGFVQKYPSVTLDVEELPTQMLLTALRDERIDAGVIALPAKESLEGLTYTVLWAESLWAYHQPMLPRPSLPRRNCSNGLCMSSRKGIVCATM